ncbi:hypothetical protein BDN72DRAFT_845225 [Pluteus cervinus]|uniref:Uncharacterized protein n=1 Tax=Pluteus cervinus TaxID=181527 RepID=A0ACD3AIJ0_9AGAR|nr:hypothetical protein BDN72DRAFT_845225 [Pluteus cervinus]
MATALNMTPIPNYARKSTRSWPYSMNAFALFIIDGTPYHHCTASLPTSSFAFFFEYQSAVLYNWPYSVYDRQKYALWISILQVSQYLRGIGLESPELWSRIAIADPRWVSEFLERSRSNDLRVVMDISWKSSHDVDLLKRVMDNSKRISALDISFQLRYWRDLLPSLKSPAPHLTVLRLEMTGEDHDLRTNPPSIPVDLFSATLSVLNHLHIEHFHVELEHPLFTKTNLTTLSIMFPLNIIGTLDMLQLLERLPALRSLCLSYALGLVSGASSYLVSLPNLTWLDLRHTGLDVNKNFLESIVLQEGVDVSLYSGEIDLGTQNLVDDVIDSVKIAVKKTSLLFRDIKIEWVGCEPLVYITCMKEPRYKSGMLASPFVEIGFGFKAQRKPRDPLEWLLKLPKSLLSPLEVLHFQNVGSIPPEIWDYLSGTLPNLRHLYLGSPDDTVAFVEYLTLRHPDDSSAVHTTAFGHRDNPEMVYPALRRLTLLVFIPPYECLLALRCPLATRKQRGMGLDELCIIDRGQQNPEARLEVEVALGAQVKTIRWREDWE